MESSECVYVINTYKRTHEAKGKQRKPNTLKATTIFEQLIKEGVLVVAPLIQENPITDYNICNP